MTHSLPRLRKSPAVAGLLLLPIFVSAATVNQTANNAGGTTGFNAATNWSDGLAPTAGNDYVTAFQLRSPTSGTATFAGDSLTFNTGGSFLLKNPGPWTVNNLILNGGTLFHGDVGGAQIGTINGNISVPVASFFDLGGGGGNNRFMVIGSAISGAGNLTVSRTGTANGHTLTFSNTANSFTGALTLNTGLSLIVPTVANGGVNSGLGAAPVAAANLVINGGALQYGGSATTSTDRLFTIGNAGATLRASGTGTAAMQFTGTGALAFTGAGARTLNLTGPNGGGNTLAAVIGNNGADITSLSIGVSGGTVKTGKWIVSGNNTFTGNVNIFEGALQISQTGSLGTGTKTVAMTNGTNGEPQLILDGSGGNIVLPSTISFTTSTSANGAAGIHNLAGNNSIAGVFSLTAGGGDTRFFADGGTLAVTGNLTFAAGSRNLNLAGAASGTVSGNILNGAQTLVGLAKNGTGTWTISGTGNTYNADTLINQGVLRLGASNVIPHGGGTGNVSLAPAISTTATLNLNGFSDTINGLSSSGAGSAIVDNTAAGASTLIVGANSATSSFGGTIQDTGGDLTLRKSGDGTLTLTSGNTFSGYVDVDDGIVSITHSNALGASTKTVELAGDAASSRTPELRLSNNIAVNVGQLLSSGAGVGAGSGVLRNISGDNSITATTAINLVGGNGGSVWQSDSGTLTVNGTIAPNTTARTLTLQGAGNGEITGAINNGAGANTLAGFTKAGTGTWTLSNASNGYTSKTTINGGTLRLTSGSEATLGNPALAADALGLNGGTLRISGSGVVLDDANRGITVGASGGTFEVDAGLALGVANSITGGGGNLSKSGDGTLNITGGDSVVGSFVVASGTWHQSGGTLSAPNASTIASGSTYTLSGGRLRVDALTIAGGFNWSGGTLTHNTTGTSLAMAADNSSAGFQQVGVGRTAVVTGDLAAGAGAVLALHASPTLYESLGIRFNNFNIIGSLALAGVSDVLEMEFNPYLLRPFSTTGTNAVEFGSLPLVTWTGAFDGNTFDNVTGIQDDGRGFAQSSFAVTDGSSLDINTYFLEYDAADKTLWFHYKVNGYVPEPDTFALLALSVIGLRTARTLRDRRKRVE